MTKNQKIFIGVLIVLAVIVGIMEIQRYRGRQAAVESLKSNWRFANTQAQQINLIHQLTNAFEKNASLLSYSKAIAVHDNALCDDLDKSIAAAAQKCAEGDSSACSAMTQIAGVHAALGCGDDHIKKEPAAE